MAVLLAPVFFQLQSLSTPVAIHSNPPSSMAIWQDTQKQGKAAFEASKYGQAERLLAKAVLMARNLGESDPRLANSAGELGRLLTVRARFPEAEKYLEEELRIKVKAFDYDREYLLPTMASLIKFYILYGTARKADPLTENLLAFITGKLQEQSALMQIHPQAQKGKLLQGFASAVAPFIYDPHIEWAILCDDLGNLYYANHRLDMADKLFKAALDIKTSYYGKQHLSIANSYYSLGSICLDKNEDKEAETYLKDSLAMTKSILLPDDPLVYSRLDKLGKCLIKEKKYQEAEDLYLNAQKLWQNEPSKYGNEARALLSLGCLYADEKKYSEAEPVLMQALQLSEGFNGVLSAQLVPYLRKYAYVLYYLGRKDEWNELRARANAISPPVVSLKTECQMQSGDWTTKPTQSSFADKY